jgi:hypothetical protein
MKIEAVAAKTWGPDSHDTRGEMRLRYDTHNSVTSSKTMSKSIVSKL